MMQMSDTHPERRRVRHVFKAWRAEGEVQLTVASDPWRGAWYLDSNWSKAALQSTRRVPQT